MSVAATSVLTAGSNVDATSYTTASISPTSGNLVLLWVYSISASAPNTPTVTGAGLTWVAVANTGDGSSLRKISLFRAMGTVTPGTLTIDFAAQTQTGAAWSIVQYTGMDTTGTDGSGAIVQSVTNNTAGANATSLTITLAAFASSNNATAGGFGIPLNTAALPAAGSGFTATGQVNQSTPNLSIGSEFNAGNDTTVDMNAGAASIPWAGIATEIKQAVAGGTPTNLFFF